MGQNSGMTASISESSALIPDVHDLSETEKDAISMTSASISQSTECFATVSGWLDMDYIKTDYMFEGFAEVSK